MNIISQQKDTVDAICWKAYGTTAMTEKVLMANPGLADYGPVLPVGLTVTLPEQDAFLEKPTLKLWD